MPHDPFVVLDIETPGLTRIASSPLQQRRDGRGVEAWWWLQLAMHQRHMGWWCVRPVGLGAKIISRIVEVVCRMSICSGYFDSVSSGGGLDGWNIDGLR